MSPDFIIGFAREGIEVTMMVAAPMLLVGLVVGLTIGILQSVTQIQEMTLTFIPKIVAVLTSLLIFAPWIMNKLVTFSANIIRNIPDYIR
jgi:flagellar biosynthetic protein FliQ